MEHPRKIGSAFQTSTTVAKRSSRVVQRGGRSWCTWRPPRPSLSLVRCPPEPHAVRSGGGADPSFVLGAPGSQSRTTCPASEAGGQQARHCSCARATSTKSRTCCIKRQMAGLRGAVRARSARRRPPRIPKRIPRCITRTLHSATSPNEREARGGNAHTHTQPPSHNTRLFMQQPRAAARAAQTALHKKTYNQRSTRRAIAAVTSSGNPRTPGISLLSSSTHEPSTASRKSSPRTSA